MAKFGHVQRITTSVGNAEYTFRSKLEYRYAVYLQTLFEAGHTFTNLNLGDKKMGVERVDYYSDEEYEQACDAEQQYYNSQPQEPDVVPCFKCGCQMYLECHEPEGNICEACQFKFRR